MGFFDKILTSFETSTYRGICNAMLDSYEIFLKKSLNETKQELFAQALDARPTYKRGGSSFVFTKGGRRFSIDEGDSLESFLRNLIMFETMPVGSVSNMEYFVPTVSKINEVVREEISKRGLDKS